MQKISSRLECHSPAVDSTERERVINIAGYLSRAARKRPDAIAIYFPEGTTQSGKIDYVGKSYRELDETSDAIAKGLIAFGFTPGIRTALMVKPSFEFFAIAFALMKMRAVMVLIDPGIGRRHLKRCLAEARPEAFIGIPLAQAARTLLGWGRETVRYVVTVGPRLFWGGITLARIERVGRRDCAPLAVETQPSDLAGILFTSGSTGPPKGVMHTHGTMAAQVEAIRETYAIEPGEVDLPTFPPFALFDPALGMTTVLPKMDPTRPAEVDPSVIIEAIERFGVTNMFGSPALLNTVGRYGESHKARLPTLRRVISAGAPVTPANMRRFANMLSGDAEIVTPYGATEALPITSISSREVLNDLAESSEQGVCVGRPVRAADVQIIQINDAPVETLAEAAHQPVGEIGEIMVRGPMVSQSYFNRPEANAQTKVQLIDGTYAHRMGDVGYFDSQGRLWFCGRKAHRVNAPSGTMFTVPCELVFNSHPSVYRSALVGIPDDETPSADQPSQRILRPVLCVELETHAKSSSRLIDELRVLAQTHPHTKSIDMFLIHPGFPVDIRHNAKIRREDLALWAREKLR